MTPPAKKATPAAKKADTSEKKTPSLSELLENKVNVTKTPNELAAETPQETQERYGINDEVPDDVHDNPNVTIDRDNRVPQIPGGTHLHPDVAKETYNSSLGVPTEAGLVTRSVGKSVYADEAEVDDKGRQGFVKNRPGDDDGTIFEGVENNFSDENENNDKPIKTAAERKADENK